MQMNCPNCGSPYDSDEIICPNCGQPLSNATYTSVEPGKKKKKKRHWRRILLILILVVLAAVIGYRIYIYEVKKQCKNVVSQIFDTVKNLDFSSSPSENLPDFLQDGSAARNFIEGQFDAILEPFHLDGIADAFGDTPGFEEITETLIDVTNFDEIYSSITESADYEILDVTADYHSCTISVHTENTDFLSMYSDAAEKITEEVTAFYAQKQAQAAQDAQDALDAATAQDEESSSGFRSFWERVQNTFSSLFGSSQEDQHDQEEKEEEEEGNTKDDTPSDETETYGSTEIIEQEISDFITDTIYPIMEEARDNAGTLSTNGTFVFGIQNGKWTLISVDNELFYSFFGISLSADK